MDSPAWRMIVVVGLALVGPPAAMAQASAEPASLKWFVATLLPLGARLAVVSGDPYRPGRTTLEVAMPDGYRLPPHYHPSYGHVIVREGAILAGMGDVLDPKHTRTLATGDSATAPAGMHHYSIAQGRTVLAVTFEGPYTITYVRAEDAPRARTFPFGY